MDIQQKNAVSHHFLVFDGYIYYNQYKKGVFMENDNRDM